MYRFPLLGLVLLLTTPAIQAQDVSYVPQIADGEIAGIQLITEFIFVNSGGPAQVNLAFKQTDGSPMLLNLVDIGQVTEHDFALGSGQSASFSTVGEAEAYEPGFAVGYAVVTAGIQGAGGGGGTSVGGTAVFIQKDLATGTVFNEAGVPLVKELSAFSLFVDTTGTRNTALAIVNAGGSGLSGGPSANSPVVRISVFDLFFNLIATTDILLPEDGQIANFISGFIPGLINLLGSVTVTSLNLQGGGGSAPLLAGLTVRTNNAGGSFPEVVPTFTAFPVVPGAAALVSAGVMGTVTQESPGRLNVALDLREAARPVKGAIFYVFDRGELISEVVRSVSTRDFASFVLELPGHPGPLDVKGVEVRLIYEGGEITPRMPVQ